MQYPGKPGTRGGDCIPNNRSIPGVHMFDTKFRQVALWMAIWLMAPSAGTAGVPHYSVSSDKNLEYLDVRACFDGALPRRLSTSSERAPELMRKALLQRRDGAVELTPQGTELVLSSAGDKACIHYQVDLSVIGMRQWRSGNWRTRDAIVLDPALWLWLPDNLREQPIRLDFELPPGYDVSAPWERKISSDTVSFEVRERMPGFEARMAIGRFSVELIELAGGRMRYALLPGEPAPDAAALRRWITSGARALISTYGHMPVPEVQLLVVPIGQGNEPVPWGEVQRGGGDAVHLYIDQRLSEDAFMDDWVLVHELSHLLHPFIDSHDRWLPEGIASYYQNVLRARAEMKTAQYAWDRLHAGFERGIRGTPSGRSLAEVSETMMRDRSFMRVYWSGAAMALLADVALRQRTGGEQSLDTALAALHDCCLPSERSWSARELMQKLDRLTGTTIFMDLYRKHVDSDQFPELGAVYAELGLQPVSANRLRLDTTAPYAAICEQIMAVPEG